MRHVNRILNKWIVTHIHERDPGRLSKHQRGQSPHLKYHLQLKTKEGLWVVVWDLKGEEGNLHGDGRANEL